MDKPKYLALADRIEARIDSLFLPVVGPVVGVVVFFGLLGSIAPQFTKIASVMCYAGGVCLLLAMAALYVALPYASILRNFVSPFLDGGTADERRVAVARMALVAGIIADLVVTPLMLLRAPQSTDAIILPYIAIWMFCVCFLVLPNATHWLVRAKYAET